MKLIRFLLFPFAIVYDLVTRIRNCFFEVGFFKSTSFDIPIIAVGNISVGGTGKTPQIEYLIRLLQEQYKVAVLSRGYKRKTKGFVLLTDKHSATEVGDEPLQYFKKFPEVFVAVDANRVNGIQQLQEVIAPEVVLLDDAYQHRKVTANFYVLLTKYNDLYVDDFLLPTGNLRESKIGAQRANVILVTKCPPNLSVEKQRGIIQKINPNGNQQVYFTSISYANALKGSEQMLLSELVGYEVLLITGIANPDSLLAFLTTQRINYKHLKFADHHQFSNQEIEGIQHEFAEIKTVKKLIVTTEKDYMRLSSELASLCYLEIETQFLNNQQAKFDAGILSMLK